MQNIVTALKKIIPEIEIEYVEDLLVGKEQLEPQEEETLQRINVDSKKPAVSVNDITIKNGKSTIIENVSLKIPHKEFVTILGPSGSGKSTLIECVIGRKNPHKGEIKIYGKTIEEMSEIIGFVPQHPELYMNQTVWQNMQNSCIKWGIKNWKEESEKILNKVKLSYRKSVTAKKLSGGQLKLLSIGMELVRRPKILVLDEPTSGLDPNSRNSIITILSQLSGSTGRTVIATTHFMDDAEQSDRILIVNDRKIIADGPYELLAKKLPGKGKVMSITLDTIDEYLLKKIERIKGIERIVVEGRTLKLISKNINLPKFAGEIHALGGYVLETKITNASMMDVFVYYTNTLPA